MNTPDAVINTMVRMPPLQEVSPAQLAQLVAPGDTVLTKHHHTGWISKMINWGQKHLLRSFGMEPGLVEILAEYTHALTITKSDTLEGIEAAFAGVDYCYLSVDYAESDLLILRHMHELTPDEYRTLQDAAASWQGTKYDFLQYLIYPFYMIQGGVPWLWNLLWNDPKKPVCSGLAIILLQSTGRLSDIKDVDAYPPARLATIPALVVKARVKLKPQVEAYVNRTAKRKPWWLR